MAKWYRVLLVALIGLAGAAIYLSGRGSLGPSNLAVPGLVGYQKAAEFEGIKSWINSEPLTVEGLKGKVVIVDFWTYSCINCQRTLPYLRSWHDKYKDDGLVIVGVHSPEFDFEKEISNVRAAVKRYKVTWPVAVDSDMDTWRAYANNYWPHKYLIDKTGLVRYDHIGEGGYKETERVIQELLSEGGDKIEKALTEEDPVPSAPGQTPELYAGYARGSLGNDGAKKGEVARYELPKKLREDSISVEGSWKWGPEAMAHARATPLPTKGYPADAMLLSFDAKDVYVVTSGKKGAGYRIYLELDGKPYPRAGGSGGAGGAGRIGGEDVRYDSSGRAYVSADLDTLYHVVSLPEKGPHTLRLSSPSKDFAVFAFTFGS